jgi:hypothetical protein
MVYVEHPLLIAGDDMVKPVKRALQRQEVHTGVRSLT